MFRNYVLTAVRNALKRKSYTFINILGLAGGIACCLMILLFVQSEISYDDYHEKAERIYRVALERFYPDRSRLWGTCTPMLGPTMVRDFPEITEFTRVLSDFEGNRKFRFAHNDRVFLETRVMAADSNFFDVFSIPFISGDPKRALVNPTSVVITEKTAKKFFADEDPIGKNLNFEGNLDLTVTGVCADVPENTHFHFDYLFSLSLTGVNQTQTWVAGWSVFTYIVTRDDAEWRSLEEKIQILIDTYFKPELEGDEELIYSDWIAAGNGYRFFLQPLKDIHLRSHLEQELEANSNIFYVYMFAFIAIFILLIACVNFMNLTTARSANRAKEIGVRKTYGSPRPQLIVQFLLESVFLSFISLLIAFGIMSLMLPAFNTLTGQQFTLGYFNQINVIAGLILFTLMIGIIAGSYPAFFLSSFRPVHVLSGTLRRGVKGSFLRNILVVFQFTISIVLIIGTIIVKSQIDFMLGKDLGYDKEHVLVIENGRALGNQRLDLFKDELRKHTNVINTTGSFTYPGRATGSLVHGAIGAALEDRASVAYIIGDYDYINTVGIKILDGRDFSRDMASDSISVLLNETAVSRLKLENPVGTPITGTNNVNEPRLNVIGVVKDFHFMSLHNDITPVMIRINRFNIADFISVRIKPENYSQTISYIEDKWNEFTGGLPFQFSFLDEHIQKMYEEEEQIGRISSVFSVIAIFISCLGLYGLAAYTSEQRTKEIGIRKVLGATVAGVVILLSKEYSKLVVISFIIAAPTAGYFMLQWLNNFAYDTGLGLWIFIGAGILTLSIALLTISFQTVKSALGNPVDSIRYE
ncbi:ABC transporter permease [candidate division KSB1 bacterium]